jgi:hypothetical protein
MKRLIIQSSLASPLLPNILLAALFSKALTLRYSQNVGDILKGPIHDQSCCATLRVVQHD